MKKYSTNIKNDFAEALVHVIDQTVESLPQETDMEAEDKMFLAALIEVKIFLLKKLITYRPKYTVTFTPVQSLALAILTRRMQFTSVYMLNRLHQIANDVEKQYS